jgi:hypothetical protein
MLATSPATSSTITAIVAALGARRPRASATDSRITGAVRCRADASAGGASRRLKK